MPDKQFKLYYPRNTVIDPMGSIIINTSSQLNPNYEWAYVNYLNAVGEPDPSRPVEVQLIGFKDTTSYKIKYLEFIKRYNSASSYIGSAACLTSPDNISCNGLGPYIINGKRYYIDFVVLYFVNTSVINPSVDDENAFILSNPIFSVDTSRCTPDYGIFIAAPKIKQSVINDINSPPYLLATAGSQNNNMFFNNTPLYSNEIGFFNVAITYRLTVLQSNNTNSFMDNIQLTASNIVLAVQNLINYGQTSITSVSENNGAINLKPQYIGNPGFRNQSYYPFILFRYISEDAPTKRVILNFTFAPFA